MILRIEKVWQAFSNGDFSCQKSEIPGAAIGRDNCGEQENRKIKNRGGIKGITIREYFSMVSIETKTIVETIENAQGFDF